MNEMRKLMEAVNEAGSDLDNVDLDAELDKLKRRFAEILVKQIQGYSDDDPETMFSYEMEMFQEEVRDHLETLGFFEEEADDDSDDDWVKPRTITSRYDI